MSDPIPAACHLDVLSSMASVGKLMHHAFTTSPSPVPGVETALLVLLAKLGDEQLRIGRLAELVHSSSSTVSRQVVVLEGLGLLVRSTDPDDARAQVVGLTPTGRQAREELLASRARLLSTALQDFTPDEVEQLGSLLSRFAVGIEEHVLCSQGPRPHRPAR